MSTWTLFQQLAVLFAMMALGYIAYKRTWITDESYKKMSSLVVFIFNPFLMISGVLGKDVTTAGSIILENIILVIIMFTTLILISIPVSILIGVPKEKRNLYRLMFTFSNIGFMGIPLVSNLYGSDCVIFVAFYILGFNILIYTYGIWLLTSNKSVNSGKASFSPKKIINPGTVACVIAVVIFFARIQVAPPVQTFVGYVGNTAVPVSMMMIGASLARENIRNVVKNPRVYKFALAKLILMPILLITVLKFLHFDAKLMGVFLLMVSMPVASITAMMGIEYGADGDGPECSNVIAFTTLSCIITVPLVSLFL